MKKNWIYLKRGLLTPEHVRKMGIRIWLYIYMVDNPDWPTGVIEGWKDRFAADDLGLPEATVRDQRARLVTDGYITCKQTQHGLRITILKWVNPRSYDGKVQNDLDMAAAESSAGAESSAPEEIEGATHGVTHGDTQGVTPHTDLHIVINQRSSLVRGEGPTGHPEAHPALAIFRAETQRYPKKAVQPEIENIVGRREEGLELWRQIVHEWVALGWNPVNVRGMLDCFNRGEVPKRGNASEPKGFAAVREAMAALEARDGH